MTPAAAASAYASAAGLPVQKPAIAERMAAGPDFGEMLKTAAMNMVETGRAAEQTGLAAMTGRTDPVAVVTAVAETELALETVVSIRDKVIAAYEEILRMPI